MDGSSRAPNGGSQKDPRHHARGYQLDLCKRAVEENIIVYLGTGCGKTRIAVMLMYELGRLIRKPSDRVCVFLAPTIPLVQQQAMVIEMSTDFKVRSYYGNCGHLKGHDDWKKEIEQYEVLVMIPQIFLYNLQHCLISMDTVALLIFDECHHAQAHKRHPYALIMKEFYKPDSEKRPHIFGMTASPITGKGGTDKLNYTKSINSLESLLNAKVCTIDDTFELESVAPSPDIKVYLYGPVLHDAASPTSAHCKKLEELNKQCISMLRENLRDKQMKLLWRQHDTLIFCLENIGLYGAMIAARILLASDGVDIENVEKDDGDVNSDLASLYLTKAITILSSNLVDGDDNAADSLSLNVLEEPFFSTKLLSLIRILVVKRLGAEMKCIIFVKRIIVARSLAAILGNIKFLDFWKCDFLVGCNSGSKNMSRTKMKSIVQKFSSGEVNLLVATNVAEEGLDIQTCNLVVRFDLPDTVASFIQSRGRARMMKSSCVFLVERGNKREEKLLNDFMAGEEMMNMEVNCRTSRETFDDLEEIFYKVHSTGASISAGSSVSLLHCYCSKLPKDQYFDPSPKFSFIEDANDIICRVSLPPNAPFRVIDSSPCQTKEEARRIACLNACKRLHELGALTDYLLPGIGDGKKKGSDTRHVNSDSLEVSDESSKEELHEMIVPAVLKDSWNANDFPINLHFYYIRVIPIPEDRQYRMFGLFLKHSLPKEAESLELDLHLARGRIVKTGFIALGMQTFNKEEISFAQDFQEMFMKIILDRSKFFSDVVPLGAMNASSLQSSKFYLLLPLKQQSYGEIMEVDWTTVRRCLLSPVFGHMGNIYEKTHGTTDETLVLLNGVVRKADIVGSLVYTPHNKLFLFVDDILYEKDADSQHKVGKVTTHAEYYRKRFKIPLSHPKQPLLKAKQLFLLHNLLHNRIQQNTEARELAEHFVELPAELCSLKIFGFSKDIGGTISLLPSLMHRVESLLAAIELKDSLSKSFPEASEIRADHILEALTTEKCSERFSLERFEVLGDSFLKYVVGRHSFLACEGLDEGQLTKRRSGIVNNSNLYELAIARNLQVYIHDELFDPMQFSALGHPCQIVCNSEEEFSIHGKGNYTRNGAEVDNIKCTKSHRWLHRKTIADVVEALVGAFLVGSGFKAAIAFLQWIGIPVDFDVQNVYRAWELSKDNMSLLDMTNVDEVEELLSHRFSYKGLLLQAFVHPSFNRHSGGCYQKLEFLGDAVLEYLITSYLYSAYPDLKPGQITDLRSLAVNNNSFAHIAVQRRLHQYIIMDSKNLYDAIKKFENFIQLSDTEKDLHEEPTCPKALGDVVESCVGAVLLDSGFNLILAWRLMVMLLEPILSFTSLHFNPTRELRELCQFYAFELRLPDPQKVKDGYFVEVEVVIKGEILSFNSTNKNSRAARKIASQEALSRLKGLGYNPFEMCNRPRKSLEEVLRSTQKKEAKLIGFDEEPIVITDAASSAMERLNLEDAAGDLLPQGQGGSSSVPSRIINSNSSETEKTSSTSTGVTGTSNPKMARSRLLEICSSKKWKAPCFECLTDEGPSHLRMFTYKVTVEIEGASSPTTLECFSEPKTTKKAAQEHAAEAAMWFLQHRGYVVVHRDDNISLFGFLKNVRLS